MGRFIFKWGGGCGVCLMGGIGFDGGVLKKILGWGSPAHYGKPCYKQYFEANMDNVNNTCKGIKSIIKPNYILKLHLFLTI